MTTPNFTSLLTALRAFVLKSRPAYRDYLGTESVEEKTVLLTGTLSATGESVIAADGFTGFTNGQTYKATIGDETVEVTAQYGTGSFSGCIVIGSSNVAPSDTIPGWMVCVYNGNLLGFGTGDWAGKQIKVATSKMVSVQKWDTKKLPEECLPEKMPEKWVEELDTGGGVLYVPMEITLANTQGTGTVSGVTFEEALQACRNGKMVVASVISNKKTGEILVPTIGGNSNRIVFELVSSGTTFKNIIIVWTADGKVRYQSGDYIDYKVIPVTVTQSDGGEYTATSDYTYERVRELVDEGKNVVVEARIPGGTTVYLPCVHSLDVQLYFSAFTISDFAMSGLRWTIEDNIQYNSVAMLSSFSLSDSAPLLARTASPGESYTVARADHVHPSEFYFVPMTVSSAGNGSYTTTTTAVFGDVKAAAVSGKSVLAKVSYLGDYVYIPLTVYASNTIIFSGSYSTHSIFTVFWVNENQPRFVRSDVLTDGSLADSTPLTAGEASSGTSVQAARADHVHPKELPDGLELGGNYIILASSTADSTKKFKITVDDSGTLTATEVTTTTT